MSPKSTSSVAPSIPVAERRKRRRAATHRDGAACAPASTGDGTAVALAPAMSGVPDARIQNRVHEVHDETDDDDEERDDDHGRLHDGVVTGRDGVQNVTADTDSAEDRLGEDRPAEERSELQPDDGHDRNEGVLERVTEDNHPCREAFRGRWHEVIAAQDLEHSGPLHNRDNGNLDRTEGDRGKHEMPEDVPEHGEVTGEQSVDRVEVRSRGNVESGARGT